MDNRIAESEDSSLRIPSSAGQHEEEAALEDVLIITTDKSLESLDDMVPVEEDPAGDGQRKKDRSRDKEEGREKVKERVRKRF